MNVDKLKNIQINKKKETHLNTYVCGAKTKQEIVGCPIDMPDRCTWASGEPGPVPGSTVADELHCSRSERSSLEVALEQESRPLSVVVGLGMDEPVLSETGKLELDGPCSMNGTPANGEKDGVICRVSQFNHIHNGIVLFKQSVLL